MSRNIGTKTRRVVHEVALWVGAVLGLVAVAAGLAATLFGCGFLVVRSGSMSPEVDTGALALTRPVPAVDLELGDVVSVRASDGALITHRLVDRTVRGDEVGMVLKGDANGSPDAEVYTRRSVARVVLDVPYLGYVLAVALTPTGTVAVASVCLMLLLLPSHQGRAGPVRRGRARGQLVVPAVVAAVVVGGVAAGGVDPTWASFNDNATMASGSFAARTLTAPTSVTCVQNGNQDYISWTAPAGLAPTAYRIFVNGSGTMTAEVTPPTTSWRPAVTFLPQTYADVRVVAVRGTWTSPLSSTSDSIRTLFFFSGTSC